MSPQLRVAALFAVMALGACATLPAGPSVPVLPGTGKSFDHFRVDDALCQQYAYEQVGGVSAQEAANRSGVQSAVVGTAIGAAAGAAFGGGQGAAIGAGSGLLLGSAVGTSAASNTYVSLQQRYDNSYIQCMFAKGNRVPVFGQFASPVPWAPSPLAWICSPAESGYPAAQCGYSTSERTAATAALNFVLTKTPQNRLKPANSGQQRSAS